MFENDFIAKIKTLKQIKPRGEWVVLTKNQILGQKQQEGYREVIPIVFNWKSLLAGALSFAVLIGVLVLSQTSLPGETLYPVKKISEKSRIMFVSEANKPGHKLALVNKRLQELTEIAEKDGQEEPEKLASAVNEFKSSVSEAARNLGQVEISTSSDPVVIKEIVEQTKKLEQNKEKVEALGVEVGATEELDNAMAQLVQREIKELETRTLTEAQEQTLAEIKQDYEAGDFSQALEKILLLGYPQSQD